MIISGDLNLIGTSANSEITDLLLELFVNLRSYRKDCWNSRVDQS